MMRLVPSRLPRLLLALAVFSFAATARAADAPAGQWRAFWVDAFNAGIKTPEQVDQLIQDVKATNCNTIIAQVRKRGDAYFRKTVDPFTEDPAVPAGFDPLADLLEKAHKNGVQVHAWVNAMTLWRAQDQAPASPRHVFNLHGPGKTGRDSWLTCDEKGQTKFPVGYFLDAGHPLVSDHLAKVVTDLARNYPVDGIHLDYIRYPETEGGTSADGYGVGYNPVSVARFNKAHGRTGLPDRNDPAWNDWRRQQVTQLVRRMRVELLDVNPKAMFSAALIPWGDGPRTEADWVKSAPHSRVFQDWHNWRKEGLLDLTVPMNYDRQHDKNQKAFYAHWVGFEKAHRYRSRLIVGQGAYMNSLEGTLEQVRLALSADKTPAADGVCFFSYAFFRRQKPEGNGVTLDNLRGALVSGKDAPFATPAAAPVVERIQTPTEGALAGIVVGEKSAALDGHEVRIEPAAGGSMVTARSDGNGFFAAVFLKPGRYKVGLPGRTEEVEVTAGKVTRVGPGAAAPNLLGD
jgi:uncharacterized lipoprotein YddW (UPF0748 family)